MKVANKGKWGNMVVEMEKVRDAFRMLSTTSTPRPKHLRPMQNARSNRAFCRWTTAAD
tara:strand:- start:58819 stop:58992 length:174 start_codon:yes stop_codon:yes gene_type:complete